MEYSSQPHGAASDSPDPEQRKGTLKVTIKKAGEVGLPPQLLCGQAECLGLV